ncbi:hypothetical protein WN943_005969 [Citrus x changshan-huyou]
MKEGNHSKRSSFSFFFSAKESVIIFFSEAQKAPFEGLGNARGMHHRRRILFYKVPSGVFWQNRYFLRSKFQRPIVNVNRDNSGQKKIKEVIFLIDSCKGSYKVAKHKETAKGKPAKEGDTATAVPPPPPPLFFLSLSLRVAKIKSLSQS